MRSRERGRGGRGCCHKGDECMRKKMMKKIGREVVSVQQACGVNEVKSKRPEDEEDDGEVAEAE